MQISEAILWGEQELKEAKVENARWDTDRMLSHVLKCRREQLYLEREHVLTSIQETEFKEMIHRRTKREPLQYILNHQEFMGLDFYVDKRVLIPRADSEILVELFLEEGKNWQTNTKETSARVLDLCTGSGALAISIAHYWPEAKVVATDISVDALEVAQYNAKQLNVQIEWRQGDFLEAVRGENWDFIVSNPPYVPLEEYIGLAKILRIGWQQGRVVQEIFQEKGYETNIVCDYGGRDRVVIVRWKGWRPSVNILMQSILKQLY